jgi:hypothetical protein
MDCLNTFKLSMLFTESCEFSSLAVTKDFSAMIALYFHAFQSSFYACFVSVMSYLVCKRNIIKVKIILFVG